MATSVFSILRNLMLNSYLVNTDDLEDHIAAMPAAYRWTDGAPVRFEIMKERMKRGSKGPEAETMPIMFPTIMGVRKSLKSLNKNPRQPKTEAPAELIADLEDYLLKLGASSVGYTRVPQRWIFRNKAILFLNAILLTMEMDKPRIDTAPSLDSLRAVLEIYRDLGRIANRGADYLRKRGYSAHAGHPLMGLALYPPLAQMAGLGWLGANGLIITSEHGPRVRLGAIFASIENLPFSTQNDHQWVEDFCTACQVCVGKCPVEAIMPEPVRRDNGHITYVINERCFPYFSDYYGCSVCIKVCPFNHTPYENIKEAYSYGTKLQDSPLSGSFVCTKTGAPL
jgi:Pyruvate/2-oxoacid:ferredoxin oxidoreductase delta subunit